VPHYSSLPDGRYPFIDERLPLSDMTMVEAPPQLETLFCVSACKIDPISGLFDCLLWREAGGGGLSVLSLFDVVVIRVFEGLPGSASRAL